jgi:NADH-quinone oxidoreductase subunit E
MSFTFNQENEQKFQELLTKYPKKSALSLPCLWMAQKQEGYISEEAIIFLANKLETTPADIYSIGSFYTMFHFEPIGKYHIQMCKTLSCMLSGSEDIKKHLEQKLGIRFGQTTQDRKFTLSEVECLGACEKAPVIQLNEDYIFDVTIEKIDKILDELE